MNCIKVQEAIWCGELNADMLAHIATCPDCQAEQRNVQALSFSLDDINIPMQNRSLLPSRREIEQSLVARKRKRWTRWGIGSVAAAACVVFAIVALPNFLAPSPNGTITAGPSGQKVATTPSNGNGQTGTSGNNSIPSDTQTLSKQTQSQSTTTDSQANTDQQLVTIDPGADPQFQEELDSVRAYLSKGSDPNIFKHITVKNFVEDVANSDSNTITGTVTLTIENQPGQSSPYGTGDQPFDVTRFATFTKQQGLWTVSSLSTSPYFRQTGDANTGGWQTITTKLYTIQLPAYLGVTVNQDGSLSITNQGKVMGTLEIEGQLQQHQPGDYYSAVFLPNHSDVLSKQMITVSTPGMHVVVFDLRQTPPAADPSRPTTEAIHTYFISDANNQLAFHLTIPTNTFNADTYNKICSSFQTK